MSSCHALWNLADDSFFDLNCGETDNLQVKLERECLAEVLRRNSAISGKNLV